METPPPIPRSWISRNWKWLVPTLLLSVAVAFAVFIGGLGYVLMKSFKSAYVYKSAVELAQNDHKAVELLGAPIQPGWYVMGNMNVSGPTGRADISIPLSGSSQDGTLYVGANKIAGEWIFEYMMLQTKDNDRRVSLLENTTPAHSR